MRWSSWVSLLSGSQLDVFLGIKYLPQIVNLLQSGLLKLKSHKGRVPDLVGGRVWKSPFFRFKKIKNMF